MAGDRGGRGAGDADHAGVRCSWDRNSCRRWTKARCSTCLAPCRGFRSRRRRSCCTLTDRILMRFPEVDHVLGKAGRADTATDPAPLSMLETIVVLKPQAQWRKREDVVSRGLRSGCSRCFGTSRRTHLSEEQLVAEMNEALNIPGRVEFVDDADPGPHRDADDGHPHAGGLEDSGHRPGGDSSRSDTRWKRFWSRCRGRAACSRNGPARDIFSM